MEATSKKFKSVDEYISSFPKDVRTLLEEMRTTVTQAAPKAQEVISYNMPAIKQHGVLVYYAAGKSHIGFYPTASPMQEFKDQMTKYKTSKGAIQFPMDQPIPIALVKKIVRFRMKENAERALAKAALTKSKTGSLKTK